MYILTITYNFDERYICKPFNTEYEAIKSLNRFLVNELEIIRSESEYEPSLVWVSNTEAILIYEEDVTLYDKDGNRTSYDMGVYKVMKAQ